MNKTSDFSKNVVTLMTGTAVAQAIPIAVSPILTRLYTPEEFGALGLFLSITSIFVTLASGRYELAIILPKKDSDAINLLALGFIICTCVSFATFLTILIFNKKISLALGNEEIGLWLFLTPISIFLSGVFNLLNYYNTRCKNYKDIRNAVVFKSIAMAITQVILGIIKTGAIGLISGQLISQIISNGKLVKNITTDNSIRHIKTTKLIALAKKYKDFPKFTMWAGLANSLSQNINNFFISTLYNLTYFGYYSFAEKILGMPASLIGSSIGQVYYQEGSREQQTNGTVYHSFIKTTKRLITIGVPFYFVLYFTVEDIFYYVFGADWVTAGSYAKILIPLFLVRFVVSPLTITNQINKKNKLGMVWQFGLLAISTIIVYTSHLLSFKFELFLHFLTITLSIYYIFFYFLIYTHVKKGH